jgi:hypothetical protein
MKGERERSFLKEEERVRSDLSREWSTADHSPMYVCRVKINLHVPSLSLSFFFFHLESLNQAIE